MTDKQEKLLQTTSKKGLINLCKSLHNQLKDLEGRYTSAIAGGHDLLKSNEAKDQTIERLESDLEEAVEIMSAIYENVDNYHLDFAFHGGECYDRLKDYLGV